MRTSEDEQDHFDENMDDQGFPWPMEELSAAETWWMILGASVNVTQIGDTTWNKAPTRS